MIQINFGAVGGNLSQVALLLDTPLIKNITQIVMKNHNVIFLLIY